MGRISLILAVILVSLGIASPVHATPSWTVTLVSAYPTISASGDRTSVVATASSNVSAGYQIVIVDQHGTALKACSYTTSCGATVRLSPGETRTVIARIVSTGASGSVIAASMPVPVHRENWALSLSSTNRTVSANSSTTSVVAMASANVGSPYRIHLFDQGGATVQSCMGVSACGGTVSLAAQGLRSVWVQIVDSGGNSVASAGPISMTRLSDSELLSSEAVATMKAALLTRYGSTAAACVALGEQGRSHAARSSVPDVTLVCMSQGLDKALLFMSGLVGVGNAIDAVETLVAAVTEPAASSPHPDCDHVGLDGSCLDEGSPDAGTPVPQPDPGGAGVAPPSNCMDRATAQTLIDSMPVQYHHLATQYGLWAADFNDVLARYGLTVEDLSREWNVIAVPHRGPHPVEYHRWVMNNLRLADQIADGDAAVLKDLFRNWVGDRVEADPTITRLAYWKCRR
jgi:hypothetical protein